MEDVEKNMQEPNDKEIGSFGNDLLVDVVRMKLRWYQGTRLRAALSSLVYALTPGGS